MTFDDECCDFVMVSIIGVRGDELVMGFECAGMVLVFVREDWKCMMIPFK